jgi:hypothetical protein
MIEASLSKLDDKGVFTIIKVENVERKVGKETITEVNIQTEEEFDGVKNFYTSRKMIVAKFYDNGKPTTLSQDIQKGKKYRVKIITQKFGKWERRLRYCKIMRYSDFYYKKLNDL